MPGGSRSLPGRPSLRHLKLEAKRRLAAGEFATLYDAQVAIAREHGLPTWAALKQRVGDTPDSHALDQLRWIIARFADADQPGWIAHEALTPQSGPGPGGGGVGLGWLITPRGDVASHAGANLDATATVTTRIRDHRTHVVLTSRMIPVNSIETRLLRAWTNPKEPQ
jgi:hypothetical protein